MGRSSEEQNLDALQRASRDGDAASVAGIWRELTPGEQESLLFRLLEMHGDPPSGVPHLQPDERQDLLAQDLDDTQAMEGAQHTVLIPKVIEDLRGLTGSERDVEVDPASEPAIPNALPDYWSRWRRWWKISALVAAWAVTTVFAFTADTSTFGPTEWVVALFGTVVGGGVLVGTLVDFAVAAVSIRAQATGVQRDRDGDVS